MHKFVRQFPFYLMRQFGVKRYYSSEEIKLTAEKWKFNVNYIDYGYAIACHPDDYYFKASEQIRKEISKTYDLPKDFTVLLVLRLSQYKDNWRTPTMADNNEYWNYMSQADELDKNKDISQA